MNIVYVLCVWIISTVLVVESNMKEYFFGLTLCCIQLIQVSCKKNVVLMIADDFRFCKKLLCSSFSDVQSSFNSVLSLSSCAKEDFNLFWLLLSSSLILHRLATSTCFVWYSSAKARLTLSSTAERKDA